MASFTKTKQTDLLAVQAVAASTVVVGSAFDMSSKLGGMCHIRFGRRSATAAGAGVNIRIETSHATSGDNSWFPWVIITTAFAAAEAETVSGTVGSGTNVITVANTTNLAAGDLIVIDNTTTAANSEWGRVKSIVTNTSITIEDNLVNAATGFTLYDNAEIYPPIILPETCMRVRAVADGASYTQAFLVHVGLQTIDSIA